LQIEPRWAPVAWEILRDTSGGSGVFLGMEQATPLVREVATAESFPDPVQVGPAGLSVLAAGANPIDLPHLDLDRERRLLGEALSGTVALNWVDQGEEALRRELRRPGAGYHVFHFAGHGSFDGKEGFIYLGREKRTPVSAEDLASMLLRCETLRLVVLNACQGAAAGKEADAVSIAERLVQRGIPAVLAMTSPILDETALQVVRDFYHSLSQGRPVEHAVNDLRLHLKRNQLEWAAPVLMMGNPRAPLFALKRDGGAGAG
jgi:CHAT domain-containing protein